ncbi:carboxylate-amine ligase [Motilibacter rhizosphaerae]|uniref:Putative glutamate--cysteine ligase 2 n=1 Tax=Motilibacter rhizosphaerae TaxID=598652 RepID=A0A4Q7NSV7_9ACTN|nr:carboxylate--amine ligase/circularly permuted type 2 ATP-grasp protein [Motilibacter rhizosphaerae]RZS89462.1 carboxylate-amine ligase [Motilibacter rhizosphaerae]
MSELLQSSAGEDAAVADAAGVARTGRLTLGVEEEFHLVDLRSRRPVPRAPELLDRLPYVSFSAELQACLVETNSSVHTSLEGLRADVAGLRATLAATANRAGLGILASGTAPLPPVASSVTPTSRFLTMLDDYGMLVREQMICGLQVHVGIPDRDLAVAVARRVAPSVPLLLALTASSPFWAGADSGYASARSLVWQRWPSAGPYDVDGGAAAHDELVGQLLATGVIRDGGMIYFDVRPSPHLPTLELRITDACPLVDDVALVAGLFRALVAQEIEAVAAGRPAMLPPTPVLRAAAWRAARSGVTGDLLDPVTARPVPAAQALRGMLERLRPQLEASGDTELVTDLLESVLVNGGSAQRQRTAYVRREQLGDVVDLLLDETVRGVGVEDLPPEVAARSVIPLDYPTSGDEAVGEGGAPTPPYAGILPLLTALGPEGMRRREGLRDQEQRTHEVTFSVAGRTQLFPVDLVPRVVRAAEWSRLTEGLTQRARALDAFLHDVYAERRAVADGIIPAHVVDGAPGLRSTGVLARHQRVRAHLCGMDLVKDSRTGEWAVLEDNLRVPSGLAYAVQDRRLVRRVLPELAPPEGLLEAEAAPRMLLRTLQDAAPEGVRGEPSIVLLSEGPSGSAWFDHRTLASEMGVPCVQGGELEVEAGRVLLVRDGARQPVDVIYMRVGEEELNHTSGADGRPLGPPLLAALDAGMVALCNAPGNGVGDDKAVYAYVPEFIRYYLGEEPELASVPTYLCHEPEMLAEVLPRLHELVLKPVDGYGGEGVLIGPLASEEEVDAARRQLLSAPHRWIAQEVVSLTTHPTFDGEHLSARHVDLRAFVLQGDEVRVAPAALTRVAPEGSMIVNSSRGGGAKDTWILG